MYSRPLGVTHSSGSAELTDNNGMVVQTGSALGHVALLDLPSSGDFEKYDRIQSITIMNEITITNRTEVAEEPVFRSIKIDSWAWHNKTRSKSLPPSPPPMPVAT